MFAVWLSPAPLDREPRSCRSCKVVSGIAVTIDAVRSRLHTVSGLSLVIACSSQIFDIAEELPMRKLADPEAWWDAIEPCLAPDG